MRFPVATSSNSSLILWTKESCPSTADARKVRPFCVQIFPRPPPPSHTHVNPSLRIQSLTFFAASKTSASGLKNAAKLGAPLQLRVDLHLPQKPLQMHPPFLDQLLAHPLRQLHRLGVRDDGDDRSRTLRVEALEEPLEVGVAAADGRDGVGGVPSTADVDAVVRVGGPPLADLLGVGDLRRS